MTKYQEILRLSYLGLSWQSIADSRSVSKEVVNGVLKKAKEMNVSWSLDENDTNTMLAIKLFPSANGKPAASCKRIFGFAYIRREFLRNGVGKNCCGLST